MNIEIKYSCRKTLTVEITADARVIVRAPNFTSKQTIDKFLNEKSSWINSHLKKIQAQNADAKAPPKLSPKELESLKARARNFLPERLYELAKEFSFFPNRVSIRAQKSRWGSCSSKGNINLNCLLLFAPRMVQDYVIIHELCHLHEMNHSARFWAQVANCMPNYELAQKWLKANGYKLMAKLPYLRRQSHMACFLQVDFVKEGHLAASVCVENS